MKTRAHETGSDPQDRPKAGTLVECTLTTLSPLHFGKEGRAEPVEYYQDGETLRRIDIRRFREGLAPDQQILFDNWYAQNEAKLLEARDGRAQAEVRRQFHLSRFLEQHNLSKAACAAALANSTRYRVTGPAPDRQVFPCGHGENGAMVLPGRMLREAIRAGLLYTTLLNHGAQLRDALWNGVAMSNIRGLRALLSDLRRAWARIDRLDLARPEREREKAARDASRACAFCMEQVVFACGRRPEERPEEIDYGDARYDLLQGIEVSDGELVTPAGGAATAVLLEHARVEPRVTTPSGPRGGVRADRWTFLECVPPGVQFRFTIRVDAAPLVEAEETRFVWIGLDERFRRLFGTYRHGESLSQTEAAIVERIADGLYRFAEAFIAADLAWEEAIEQSGVLVYGFREPYAGLVRGVPVVRLGEPLGFSSLRLGEMVQRNDVRMFPALAVSTGLLDPASGVVPEPVAPVSQSLPSVDGGYVPAGWCKIEWWPEPVDVLAFSPPEVRPPLSRPQREPSKPARNRRTPPHEERQRQPARSKDTTRPAEPVKRPTSAPAQPPPPPPKPTYRVGDKVRAEVIRTHEDVFTLRVGNSELTYKGLLPWRVGDHVKVKILKTSADGAHVKQIAPA